MKPVHKGRLLSWLRYQDSNLDCKCQKLECCHYTIPQFRVQRYQLFSNCLEIIADEGGTIVGEQSGDHFSLGMEEGWGEESVAPLGV